MDKQKISELLDAIPDDIDFQKIAKELLDRPGINQTTLGTFVHSSKSGISRIVNEGRKVDFKTGVGLLRMYVTLCPDKENTSEGG